MLITRRWSQGWCKVIPAGGRLQQRFGVESQFLRSARSPPPPWHALTVPTAPGGSVLPCPPAVPGDVSCMGRYVWELLVSRSSALTPCAAARQVLDFCMVAQISLFNHPCFTLVQGCAVLSWGSEDTKDLEKDSFLGKGPAEDTGSGVGHVSTCTHRHTASAGAGEAPSGHLRKHEAVVKLPGAQP